MSNAPRSNPQRALTLAALSAGLFLAGCGPTNEPAISRAGVVAGSATSTAPLAGPEPTVTSTTGSVPTSTGGPAQSAAATAATSAVPAADLDQSLAGIDRDLADLDHQLTDADHDVATPEGDIR